VYRIDFNYAEVLVYKI